MSGKTDIPHGVSTLNQISFFPALQCHSNSQLPSLPSPCPYFRRWQLNCFKNLLRKLMDFNPIIYAPASRTWLLHSQPHSLIHLIQAAFSSLKNYCSFLAGAPATFLPLVEIWVMNQLPAAVLEPATQVQEFLLGMLQCMLPLLEGPV